MADAQTTIQDLIDAVARFEAERDWRQFHAPKNLAMGLSIEAGELMEHFLWLSEEQSRALANDPQQMALVREEVADVLAYLLMLAHNLGIDLSDAFHEKMRRNALKYPADQYRGKYKL
jgi:dCTP diphosphatase